jgi:uncharacterized protein YbjT (DUF2867 family)
VAEFVVAHALDPSSSARVELAGPEQIRLPELTRRLLALRGDARPVKTTPTGLPGFAGGALLAPDSARVIGPTVAEWCGARER